MNIKLTPLLETLKLQKIEDIVYFSEYKNYVSNSRMGLIYDFENKKVTADRFFEGFQPIYSTSLDIGTAVHSKILQKDLFNIVDSVDRPTCKMGALADELFPIFLKRSVTSDDILKASKKIDYYKGNPSKARVIEVFEKCQDYWKSKKEYLETCGDDPRTDLYLDSKSRETAYSCIRALENSKQIQKLLKGDKFKFDDLTPIVGNEDAILLDIRVDIEDKSFILKLKAKLDNYIIDTFNNAIEVNDIKTLGRTVDQMSINISKYHYNRELSFYCWLLKLVAKKFYNITDPITVTSNYLVVSTIPQYYTKVVPMTKKMFTEGLNEVKFLLRLIAKEIYFNHKEFVEWI